MNHIIDKYLEKDFLLFAVKKDGSINAMTCGWATEGILFNKHVFTVYVRRSRYTFEFLEEADDFYIGTASAEMIDYFGSVSGRDEDKIVKAGFKTQIKDGILYVEGVSNLKRLKKILALDFKDYIMIDDEINKKYQEDSRGHVAFVGEVED